MTADRIIRISRNFRAVLRRMMQSFTRINFGLDWH